MINLEDIHQNLIKLRSLIRVSGCPFVICLYEKENTFEYYNNELKRIFEKNFTIIPITIRSKDIENIQQVISSIKRPQNISTSNIIFDIRCLDLEHKEYLELNRIRDKFLNNRAPFILWINEKSFIDFTEYAPDLWRIRELMLVFTEPSMEKIKNMKSQVTLIPKKTFDSNLLSADLRLLYEGYNLLERLFSSKKIILDTSLDKRFDIERNRIIKEQIPYFYNELAINFLQIEAIGISVDYYRKSHSLYLKLNDIPLDKPYSQTAFENCVRFGKMLIEKKQYDDAKNIFSYGLSSNKSNKENFVLAECYMYLAIALMNINEKDSAKNSLSEAKKILKSEIYSPTQEKLTKEVDLLLENLKNFSL